VAVGITVVGAGPYLDRKVAVDTATEVASVGVAFAVQVEAFASQADLVAIVTSALISPVIVPAAMLSRTLLLVAAWES